MAKTNRKGRTRHTPFINLHRGVTNSPAWKSLTCEARCLVLLVWERHNGVNNGVIPLSHREAKSALGIGSNKTVRAFKQAREHGFLVERTKGSFSWKQGAGQGRATEWEITTEPRDGKPATLAFREWQKQNTAPDAGTAGTQCRNRSGIKTTPKGPNGSRCGNRFARFRVVNGS